MKATEPTMVNAIQNATAKHRANYGKCNSKCTALDVILKLPKNITSIVPKQPSNVALHDNATSIEMANRLIDAASFASLNAHATLTNLPKNITSIVPKQPSNVALHDNATSIEMLTGSSMQLIRFTECSRNINELTQKYYQYRSQTAIKRGTSR
jgi:hypothetical protein